MNDEITLTLNSPITDEEWNAITDVDFDHTDRIWFHTKHGKDVEFVKSSSAWHASCTDCPLYDHERHCCPRGNRVIRETLKDAQPERKTEQRQVGKWIHIRTESDGNAWYECPFCHKGERHVPIVEVAYCWNCGARMEGDTDETD